MCAQWAPTIGFFRVRVMRRYEALSSLQPGGLFQTTGLSCPASIHSLRQSGAFIKLLRLCSLPSPGLASDLSAPLKPIAL